MARVTRTVKRAGLCTELPTLGYNTGMQRFVAGRIFGLATSFVIVASMTLVYTHAVRVNQTTVALSFLLAILAVSAVWGMAVSVVMSLAALLVFNYYFLPPTRTLTIADPQNWVALGAFLFVSIMGSELSARIRAAANPHLQADLRKHASEKKGIPLLTLTQADVQDPLNLTLSVVVVPADAPDQSPPPIDQSLRAPPPAAQGAGV